MYIPNGKINFICFIDICPSKTSISINRNFNMCMTRSMFIYPILLISGKESEIKILIK